MPCLPKGALASLGIKEILRGKLYGTGQSQYFTLIHTGIGQSFTGDAVLYLKETKANNLFLFGSCGLIKQSESLNIGSLVSPYQAYNMESFCDMLYNKFASSIFYPDKKALKRMMKRIPRITEVTCATVGSLKLEEENAENIFGRNIDVVDMECSAFFAAAKFIKRKAAALFYISDIARLKPFYYTLSNEERLILLSSIKESAELLREFIQEDGVF